MRRLGAFRAALVGSAIAACLAVAPWSASAEETPFSPAAPRKRARTPRTGPRPRAEARRPQAAGTAGSLASVVESAKRLAERIQHDVLAGIKSSEDAMRELTPALKQLSRELGLTFGDRLEGERPEGTAAEETDAAKGTPPLLVQWRRLVLRLSQGVQGDITKTVKELQEMADEAGP